MEGARLLLLQEALERGVGAGVVVEPDSGGLRTGLRCHFAGLTANEGPRFTITPSGLRRHRVSVSFGSFALPCIRQMQQADADRVALARALVREVAASRELSFAPDQSLEDWHITGPNFAIDVQVRDVADPGSDAAVTGTARNVMVPLMAAMAELIGYDEAEPEEYDEEGRITHSTVTRRERSPRNRLLCLTIHGNVCAVCGLVPTQSYAGAGSIIEVHHLEPVSNLAAPRVYDPATELVPLCPNCHRAIHTRRPVPYSVEELQKIRADAVS